jgi:DNA-binding response OmpR family regulator
MKMLAIGVLAHIRMAGDGVVCWHRLSSGLRPQRVFPQTLRNIMESPPLRILCTEDDADTRELITFVLRRNNFEVVTTETPALAIEIARDFSFDLYLLDNWMPAMSGADLCKELRSFDARTPILFYSGAGYEKDKTAAYTSGAQGYLVKPVDNEELVAEVHRLIAQSRTSPATQTAHAAHAAVKHKGQQLVQFAVAS